MATLTSNTAMKSQLAGMMPSLPSALRPAPNRIGRSRRHQTNAYAEESTGAQPRAGWVRLLTRNGLGWTDKYPAIARAVASLDPLC
jgi:hypothetical protein